MAVLPEWVRASGPVTVRGRLRVLPEDFRVEEVLGFEADGAGEHLLVKVEKRGANTLWVARQLARAAGIPQRDVSYAGIKDRHAVAVQHFSLWLGKRTEPDWAAVANPEFRVLSVVRHGRKLRIGALKGNRFQVVLRDISEPAGNLEEKLAVIRFQGVPNYFGPQRFGRDGANIESAAKMFSDSRSVRDRKMRGLLLSAARSLIFNAVLSRRVVDRNWNRLLPGEMCMLDGTHSVFHAETVDAELEARCSAGDVHPTGPLWGRGAGGVSAEVQKLESAVADQYALIARGLETAGLEAARRALRLPVPDLNWAAVDERTLRLEFFLPAGAYATAVVRELLDADGGERDADQD